MTRRRKIQIASVVAAVVVALAGTTACGYWQAEQYRMDLEYGYRRAFNDLSDHVTGMGNALTKAVYANTPTQQRFPFFSYFGFEAGYFSLSYPQFLKMKNEFIQGKTEKKNPPHPFPH